MNADISWLPQRSKLLTAFNVVATVWLIGLTALRTYWNYSVAAGQFDWENRGLSDFHNGTYYPTLAIRNGDTPYVADVVTKYPMISWVPLFFVPSQHFPGRFGWRVFIYPRCRQRLS